MIDEIKIIFFKTERTNIFYLKSILEAYEGMVLIRTLKRVTEDHAIIEILINPNFTDTILPILGDFQAEIIMEKLTEQEAEDITEWVHPANKLSKWKSHSVS